MKALFAVGLIVLLLGFLSFFVPVPHSEHHGVRAGDLHVGVTTEHSDRVPVPVSYRFRRGRRLHHDRRTWSTVAFL